MRIEQSLRYRDRATQKIRDIYSRGVSFGHTSKQINESRIAVLAELAKKSCPAWVSSYVDGYAQALNDDLYKNNLVFGCFIRGKFHSTYNNRDDYYMNMGLTPNEYHDESNTPESKATLGHYWSHDTSKPFFTGVYGES